MLTTASLMNISVYPQAEERLVSEQSARMECSRCGRRRGGARRLLRNRSEERISFTWRSGGCGRPGKLLRGNSIDIILLDLKGPGSPGLELLDEIKTLHPETAIIVMTAFATVTSAVEAMRTGATDYLTKPFALDELATVLERASERRTLDLASRRLREKLRTQQGLGNIIGRSAEMDKIYRNPFEGRFYCASGADPWRERDGQGDDCAVDPFEWPARFQAIYSCRLQLARSYAGGKRAVWLRQGRIYGR